MSVHQLFSDELPDTEDLSKLSASRYEVSHHRPEKPQDLAVASLLERQRRLLHRPPRIDPVFRASGIPKPHLGVTPDPLNVDPAALEARLDGVRHAQARTSQQLTAALLRRRAVSRASASERWTDEESRASASPWPGSTRRSPTPQRFSRRTTPTPTPGPRVGSPRSATPSPVPSRPLSRLQAVPAVFPFPEPIPHSIPDRRTPSVYSRPVKPSRKEQDELNAGRSRKSKVGMPDFVAKHRRLANSWIGETAPAAERRHGPTKATWLALSREAAANFKRRHAAFRNMPCMPFDVWLLMKREEEIATDYGHKVES